MQRFLPALLVALTAAGCTSVANRQFTRPDQANLALGRSTAEEVIGVEGTPQAETVSTARDLSPTAPQFAWAAGGAKRYDLLTYGFAVRNNLNGNATGDNATFILADGRLAGWRYMSSDPAHGTDFDEAAGAALLAKGSATHDGLVALLGPPGGQLTYPLTPAPGLTAWVWQYRGPDKATGKRVVKLLQILCNADGRVLASDARQADEPPPAPSRTVVVPIIL